MISKKLVAAIACRNNGSRLYGKPLQNLDVSNQVTILDNIIGCLKSLNIIGEIVLGISVGSDNLVFEEYAINNKLKYILGDLDAISADQGGVGLSKKASMRTNGKVDSNKEKVKRFLIDCNFRRA